MNKTTNLIIYTVAGLLLMTVIVGGIGSCVSYERNRERACLSAGGVVTRVNNSRGVMCAKITIEPLEVTGF